MTEKIEVLNSGDGWVAVNKPSGVSAHNDSDSAIERVRLLLLQDQSLAAKVGWRKNEFTPSPVHRLDRETSGILLVATQKSRATELQQLFQNHRTLKNYRAILRGSLPSQTLEGVWDAPLTDKAEGRKNPAGARAERKACTTRFQVCRKNRYFTEVQIQLETGRQHQIRRHAALAGHAVVNDSRYGDPRHQKLMARLYGTERMMLHAERLVLPLPSGHIEITSQIPKEFEKLLESQVNPGQIIDDEKAEME